MTQTGKKWWPTILISTLTLGLGLWGGYAIAKRNSNTSQTRPNENGTGKSDEVSNASNAPSSPKSPPKSAEPPKASPAKEATKRSAKAKPTNADEFPLQLGSTGQRVERLQIWLLRNYGANAKNLGVLDHTTLKHLQRHLKTEQVSAEFYQQKQMDKPIGQQKATR